MKNILHFIALAGLVMWSACSLDIPNPNAATEEQVLNTKDGLLALAKGMQQHYATTTLPRAILYPAVTAREVAAMTTFSSLEELEEGGPQLSGENERVTRLFSAAMKTKGMAESILDHVDNVQMLDGTRTGLRAIAALYRGMCVGILAYNWEMVPLKNSADNDAVFVDRIAALRDVSEQMGSALTGILNEPPSDEFNALFGGLDLANALRMYIARFYLIAGDYQIAGDMAGNVDPNADVSMFFYDAKDPNPVYSAMFEGTVQYAPRKDFGLPPALAPDPQDNRIGFYLAGVTRDAIKYPAGVDSIVAPFFSAADAGIPVYYPSEAGLIRAEALARLDDLTNAQMVLNQVRGKMPGEDPLGIGAGLPSFDANGDKDALLAEIYKTRRIELFLSGTALEDSRRFGRPDPPMTPDYSSERNRNYYPYPADERLNNPNTPSDPTI